MRLRKSLICLLIICALLQGAIAHEFVPLPETTIAVLKSDQNAVYDQILSGFRNKVRSRFVEFNMNGNQQTGREEVAKINQGNFSLVLAIGNGAALVAKE